MEREPDNEIIAPGRRELINYEPAHMYYRGELYSAPEGSDEHRIYEKIAEPDFFMEQIPEMDPEDDEVREHLSQTMMTEEAIKGSENMNIQCQIPFVAFMCRQKNERPEGCKLRTQDEQLLKQYDGTNFIWTDHEDVVDSLREHRLTAVRKDGVSQLPKIHRPTILNGNIGK